MFYAERYAVREVRLMGTFEFMPQDAPNAMRIALGMNAISFLSQLSRSEADRISKSLQRFAWHYDDLQVSHVNAMKGLRHVDGHVLRAYRADHDVRVFFYTLDRTIYVVDIVRRSQLERIESLRGSAA